MCVCVKKEEGHWFESSLNEQRVTSDPITMLTWSTAGGGNNPGAEATSGNTCSVCLLCEVSGKKKKKKIRNIPEAHIAFEDSY